jgi:peptidoglycan/LPS O-acetylase OafA/YrhL
LAQAGFAFIIASALGAGLPKALRALLTARPLQLCGMMCYSLYIWQMAGPVQRTAPWWDVKDVPVYVLLLLLLSAMSYRYIEFPKKSIRELFSAYPH